MHQHNSIDSRSFCVLSRKEVGFSGRVFRQFISMIDAHVLKKTESAFRSRLHILFEYLINQLPLISTVFQ